MSKPNWQKIRQEWETSDITFKALAEKYDVKDSTIRSRKNREKWERNATKGNATQRKSVATEKKSSVANDKKRTTSKQRKKRSGNPNPKNQFTERNQAALKHGLFSRYIPKETLEIMDMLNKEDPADLIWDQIMIQYAAIIRAQEIMFVNNRNDIERFVTKERSDDFADEKQYEIHTSWDRHATFMNAQSRAISELRTSIRQFVDMTNEDDERRLRLEQMQTNINKLRVETKRLESETGTGDVEKIVIVDEWADNNE